VEEDWQFFNILCILEGGNGKFLKHMAESKIISKAKPNDLQLNHSSSILLPVGAYIRELSERVSRAFEQLTWRMLLNHSRVGAWCGLSFNESYFEKERGLRYASFS
jgi:hypothetical protein